MFHLPPQKLLYLQREKNVGSFNFLLAEKVPGEIRLQSHKLNIAFSLPPGSSSTRAGRGHLSVRELPQYLKALAGMRWQKLTGGVTSHPSNFSKTILLQLLAFIIFYYFLPYHYAHIVLTYSSYTNGSGSRMAHWILLWRFKIFSYFNAFHKV